MALKILGHQVKQSQKIIVTRGEDDSLEFVSSIEYSGPRGLSITLPLHNQVAMKLRRGQEVCLKVPTESFIMEFKSRVRSFTADNVILVNLENPTEYKRVQRRKSFRLKILLDVQIAPDPGDDKQKPMFERATALNISAGGMEVAARSPYRENDLLLVMFDLELEKNNTCNFCLKARVRRIVPEDKNKYRLGLEFQDLSNGNADRICRYIFKKSADQKFWEK
ncbi:MAG: PilZ domain-containing protein [Peptococcaceae bacterium]|nr:PilZ domain-containing protein [Peptococcaceae bacterium]